MIQEFDTKMILKDCIECKKRYILKNLVYVEILLARKEKQEGKFQETRVVRKWLVKISTNSPVVGLLSKGQGEMVVNRFLFPLSQQTLITVRRSRSTLPTLVWQISAIFG